MIKTPANIGVDRLKKVLISDKHFNPEKIKEVIKSDIFFILKNYTDIKSEDMNFDINVSQDGWYKISLKAKAKRLKVLGSIPE